MYKVACIGDSPKVVRTGFGVVNRQMYAGFIEAGFDVHVLGLLDFNPDGHNELPYRFSPVPPLDRMGTSAFVPWLKTTRPDVVYILADPGTLHYYSEPILKGQVDYERSGRWYRPAIVAYTPIEGYPIWDNYIKTFRRIQEVGGQIVTYSLGSAGRIYQESGLEVEWVHHGTDHASFRRFSAEDRQKLKKYVGFGDDFVIGAIGVNKRTKHMCDYIYVAHELKFGLARGVYDDFVFYLHTEGTNDLPMMEMTPGYPLTSLRKHYDVEGMVFFKPDSYKELGGLWMGVPYEGDIAQGIIDGSIEEPTNEGERRQLFAQLDMIGRFNCFDLYLDLSGAEGWGLPLFEAMACGVPSMTIHDGGIRDEVVDGALALTTLPRDIWDTWHTGARIARADPKTVAREIVWLRRHPEGLLEKLSARGQENAARFTWAESTQKMAGIVERVAERATRRYDLVKPVEFTFRSGTADQAIYIHIIDQNEYELEETFGPTDVILDIGAHIGVFSYACLLRGAGKVIAVEPVTSNFERLTKHLSPYGDAVELIQKAIWRSDIDLDGLQLGHTDFDTYQGVLNTGAANIVWGGDNPVELLAFDDLVERVTAGGQKRIRLLKLDCESSEWPILYTSQKLDLVDEICGEFHELGGNYDQHDPSILGLDGHDLTASALETFLYRHGFVLGTRRHIWPDGRPSNMGMFFAKRPENLSEMSRRAMSGRAVARV